MSNYAVQVANESITVEVTPTLKQTLTKGALVTYHGTMKGFQGQPLTVRTWDAEGRLCLVTEGGRMIGHIRPNLVRLVTA